jgi:hypothetical protein
MMGVRMLMVVVVMMMMMIVMLVLIVFADAAALSRGVISVQRRIAIVLGGDVRSPGMDIKFYTGDSSSGLALEVQVAIVQVQL